MSKRVEEEYLGVLQKIEYMFHMIYDRNPSLTDYEVIRLLENLIIRYKREASGMEVIHQVPTKQIDLELDEAVSPLCENYLGRGESIFQTSSEVEISVEQLTVDELLLCLKRLLKSAKRWNKTGGRKGYLNFIAIFFRKMNEVGSP